MEATQQECPEAPGSPGGDNRTHHMVPLKGEMRCSYCGRTQAELEGRP